MEVFPFITNAFKFCYINAMKKVFYASFPLKDKISRHSTRGNNAT